MFIYANHVLKDRIAAITMALLACVFPRHSFFAVYELIPGLVLFPLMLSHLQRINSASSYLDLFLAVVCALIACYFHSALVLVVFFTLVIWYCSYRATGSFTKIGIMLMFLLIVSGWMILFFSERDTRIVFHTFQLSQLHSISRAMGFFGAFMLEEHFLFLFVSLVVVTLLLIQKQWLQCVSIFVFSVLYVFLISLAITPGGQSYSLDEVRYSPLSVFMLLPLGCVLRTVVEKRHSIFAAGCIVGILTLSLYQIVASHGKYSSILSYKQELIDYCTRHGIWKGLWNSSHVNREHVELEWSFPEETLLISSMNSTRSSTIYITESKDQMKPEQISRTAFLVWSEGDPVAVNSNQLNPKYFFLPTAQYKTLNTVPTTGSWEALWMRRGQIKISVLSINEAEGTFTVRISNKTGLPLYSAGSSARPIHIWYRILPSDTPQRDRVPLEVDVMDYYHQNIKPETLLTKNHRVVVDLFTPKFGRWRLTE